MFIEKEKWDKLVENMNILYSNYDSFVDNLKNLVDNVDICVDDIKESISDKVYVITNNAVVDDEIIYDIAGVTTSLEEAKYLLSETVKDIKCDADFDTLNAVKLTDDINPSKLDEVWVYEENDLGFELYLNGNYNSNSYSAQIEKFDIMKELDKDNSMEI